jgi:alanyl-tRNA synthetase
MVTPDLVARGVRAGDVVKEAATLIDGRGGGRPDLAEAGGRDASKLDDALASVTDIVRRGLGV